MVFRFFLGHPVENVMQVKYTPGIAKTKGAMVVL
jgi:hypothetical protein